MQPSRKSKAFWLCCCWLISTASAGIVVSPAAVHPNNPNSGPAAVAVPNGSESIGTWPSGSWTDRRRSSEAEVTAYSVRNPNEIGTYAFGYDNARDSSGNEHFRFEERFANGTVVGEYGFTDYLNSAIVTVSYTADENGFRPIVKMRRIGDFALPGGIQSLD